MYIRYLAVSIIFIVSFASCSSDSASGSGLTIAERIEAAAGEAAVDSMVGSWFDNGGGSTYDLTGGSGTVRVSDDIGIVFAKNEGRFFTITGIEMGSVVDTHTIVGVSNGSVAYDSIANTMTFNASGTFEDTANDTATFALTITITGISLPTLSTAKMFTFTSATMNLDYNSGERTITYAIAPGMLPLMAGPISVN